MSGACKPIGHGVLSIESVPQRALLVEDEVLVAMAVADSLRLMGFEAVVAATGEEALQAVAQHGPSIALAMIDIGLPDMRGDVLARRVRHALPSLPIVLSTGYDGAELARDFAGDGQTWILPKPYSEAQLRLTLAELGRT